MYKNSFVHYLTKYMVDVMFYGGILCCFLLPFIVKRAGVYFGYGEDLVVPLTFTLVGSGIAAVYIMYCIKSMFTTLLGGNPFVWNNVSCFRRIAVASFIIALFYVAKCLYWFTLSTVLIAIIFIIAGLFCLTLKDVFKQAIYYKEENDYTV